MDQGEHTHSLDIRLNCVSLTETPIKIKSDRPLQGGDRTIQNAIVAGRRTRYYIATEASPAVLADMAEKNVGKKPESQPVMGKEKPDSETSEVSGRGKQVLYTCFNDGAGNYVPPDAKSWTCWRCGQTIVFDW
jgi:hypothetical protein